MKRVCAQAVRSFSKARVALNASRTRPLLHQDQVTATSASFFCSAKQDEKKTAEFVIKNGKERLSSADFFKNVKEAVAKDVAEEEFVLPKEAVDAVAAEYDALREENADIMDKYRRALAEAENTRRIGQKRVEDTKIFAIQGFCKDLLEAADNLDLALQSVTEKQIAENPQLGALHKGVAMTKTELLKTFAKHGLVPINPQGEKFDPNKHDALFQMPAEVAKVEPGHIAQVMKTGYALHDRTIRAAHVGVAKEN
ncbi:hypothetical protein L596_025846 [Steinernema carpocapsae]|uniref:GrpE protein homolog n=1 Tax=Steinernema carpocapsae TaxID=34508 RepID=A0A4U5M8Z3_STECR|nr:hypothetical protein L596_025846 [Steinernema carpocapsae]